jgi:two-component system phosphate regulon sensor histidine kinase PhoR
MMLTALIGLSLALLWALYQLGRHRAKLRLLNRTVRARRLLLQERQPETGETSWDALAEATNSIISENAELQQLRSGQLAQLQATLGTLREAVLILDPNNYVLLANSALHTLFPQAQNIIGERVESVLHSRDFQNFVEELRRGRSKPQTEMEFLTDTDSIWMQATGTIIPSLDGKPAEWALFVLHDVTRQKQLESVRKDFVANVSHELRTPLSIIKGYAETLLEGHRDMSEADREQFLRTIHRHGERLHLLLEDLLSLSRLEAKGATVHRESLKPIAFTAAVVEDYRSRPAARAHTLEFTHDPVLPDLLADPLKLTQVFENLLNNALKYTPPGSTISIALHRHADELEISVRDNGPGIPAADLPHLFERFYRVDKGRSRETGGTGLGLSIVKHICQLHGGRTWAESELGKGTTFRIRLPLNLQARARNLEDSAAV